MMMSGVTQEVYGIPGLLGIAGRVVKGSDGNDQALWPIALNCRIRKRYGEAGSNVPSFLSSPMSASGSPKTCFNSASSSPRCLKSWWGAMQFDADDIVQ